MEEEKPRQTSVIMTSQLAEVVASLESMSDREGGQTDCVKLPEYLAAITWMQDLGYAGVEAYDDSKFYYILLPQHGRYDLASKVAAEVATTGRDPLEAEALIIRQEFAAERLHAERRARLRATMAEASTAPDPTPAAPKKASAAGVVITFLLMFLFAIFLTWACFIR